MASPEVMGKYLQWLHLYDVDTLVVSVCVCGEGG